MSEKSDLKEFLHLEYACNGVSHGCVFYQSFFPAICHDFCKKKKKKWCQCWSTPMNSSVRNQYPSHIHLYSSSLGSYNTYQHQVLLLPAGFLCWRAVHRLSCATSLGPSWEQHLSTQQKGWLRREGLMPWSQNMNVVMSPAGSSCPIGSPKLTRRATSLSTGLSKSTMELSTKYIWCIFNNKKNHGFLKGKKMKQNSDKTYVHLYAQSLQLHRII